MCSECLRSPKRRDIGVCARIILGAAEKRTTIKQLKSFFRQIQCFNYYCFYNRTFLCRTLY
jgi:hypothetical protein